MSKELTILNGKLTATSYVSGVAPSKDDATTFKEMFGGNNAVVQWAARMASYYQSERDEILTPGAAAKKGGETKHADPAAATAGGALPLATVQLLAKFEKFSAGQAYGFSNLKQAHMVATLKAISTELPAADINAALTNGQKIAKFLETYATVSKVEVEDKHKKELASLVEAYAENFGRKVEEKPVQPPQPDATKALIKNFSNMAAAEKLTFTSQEGIKNVLAAITEDYHFADINTMLTTSYDCDELLEAYSQINSTPTDVKLKMRNELVGLVEKMEEAIENGTTFEAAAPVLPLATVQLLAKFEKFSAGQAYGFSNLKQAHMVATLKAIQSELTVEEINGSLTNGQKITKFLAIYYGISKAAADDKFKKELASLVEAYAENFGRKVEEKKVQPPQPDATKALIVKFIKFAEGEKLTFTSVEGVKATMVSVTEDYHFADINTFLTTSYDCDELLEAYSQVNNTPTNDKLKMRNELVSLVEKMEE